MLSKYAIIRFILLLFITSGLLGCLGGSHHNSQNASGNETSNNNNNADDQNNGDNAPVNNINDDNTTNTIQFNASAFNVNEDDGTASITVVRVGDPNNVVSVDYSTRAETATAGEDYTASSGTLTFGASETEKSFTVSITDDTGVEGDGLYLGYQHRLTDAG